MADFFLLYNMYIPHTIFVIFMNALPLRFFFFLMVLFIINMPMLLGLESVTKGSTKNICVTESCDFGSVVDRHLPNPYIAVMAKG